MRKKSFLIVLAELLLLVLSVPMLVGPLPAQAETFANPAFQTLWNRTDGPVATGAANRPFFWGAAPLATRTERYDNSPAGQRLVQYFAKGRMEITRPDADTTNEWYVTSGLLVRDMVGGIVQTGDNLALAYDRAEIPVVGDTQNPLPTTPVYRDFYEDAFSSSLVRSRVGQSVTRTIRRGGETGTRSSSAQPKVLVGYYDTTSHHNIPAPFWDFMNATGPITTPTGQNLTGPLFEWQYLMGYPLTEPYWTTARLGDQNQEVLIQLFQRRAVIFNPAAPAGRQVDFTEVGRHWYDWQYGSPPTYSGPLDVPASVNATIAPPYGDVQTVFRFVATGYRASEKIALRFTQPDGTVLTSNDFGGLPTADKSGTLKASFYGGDLATEADNGLGVYKLELNGQDSGRASIIYWRIIDHVPLTPASPYDHDTSPAPPSVNAGVDPSVGPRGTAFSAFVNGFQLKDIFHDRLASWVTSPEGDVTSINLQTTDLLLDAQEALDGMGLLIASPPRPGVWAITIADKANPTKQAIIYLKITAAPPELTIGAALRIYTRGTTSDKPAAQGWEGGLKLPNHKPTPAQPVQPEGGNQDGE